MDSKGYQFFVRRLMDLEPIEADSIELKFPDGSRLDFCINRQTGEATIYASDRLIIKPQAANCARVSDNRD